MSYMSVKEFSEVRKSVTERRKQILDEINSKKSITKKQCQQYIEDLCDVVISYDPTVSLSAPALQPFVKLVDIDVTNRKTSTEASATSSSDKASDVSSAKENAHKDDQLVAKTSASDDKSAKDGIRYKGVIRGIDSLSNGGKGDDDDWSAQPKTSPPKKAKTTRRKTRSQAKTTTGKSDDKSNEDEPNDWSSTGQVLGGDTPSEVSLTQEEKRRLLAEKTEQRLAQMTKRGAKGVVRLSTRAQANIDGSNLNESNSSLQWKI